MISSVGAWAGSWALSNPRDAVSLASAAGLDRLDIIVNDHSAHRGAEPFDVRDIDKIRRLSDGCHGAGLAVHFMSWIKPDREYLLQARHTLGPLMDLCGVESIQWDAEEPWTLADRVWGHKRKRLGNAALLDAYNEAAAFVAHLFEDVTQGMGVNAIGYTPHRALAGLIAASDYAVPQLYVTSTSGLLPGRLANVGKRWASHFQWRPDVVGLAAYRQKMKGYSVRNLMRASFEAVEDMGSKTAVYWQLRSLSKQTKRTGRWVPTGKPNERARIIRELVDETTGEGHRMIDGHVYTDTEHPGRSVYVAPIGPDGYEVTLWECVEVAHWTRRLGIRDEDHAHAVAPLLLAGTYDGASQ